jgi:hypothetical protein
MAHRPGHLAPLSDDALLVIARRVVMKVNDSLL